MKPMLSFQKIILFSLIATLTPALYPVNVIFDLGEVLIETNTKAALQATGFKPFIRLAASNPLKLLSISTYARYKCLYKYLNAIKPTGTKPYAARDENNVIMPQLMCDWLTGTSGKQVLNQIKTFSHANPEIAATTDYKLFVAMARMMFTPELFAKTRQLIPETATFARACKAQGHNLYILSNWDKDSFELFRQAHADFFDLFDGIVITGKVGAIKPDPAPYTYLLNTYRVRPQDCVFIDDRPENIETANKLGIKGILCTKARTALNLWRAKPNIALVRETFNAHCARAVLA